MKIAFAGTTEFGIPTLEMLKAQHELVLIITQPDKPAGRNKELTESPIKMWALKNNLDVVQPEKISEIMNTLADIKPDLLLVAAYGQILPKEILNISKFGSVNIHGSLLPKYRGASPIQTALLNGDKETGITLLLMDEKMDHGPIIAKRTIPIDDKDDYLSLYNKLAKQSAQTVAEVLPNWFDGKIKAQEQDHNRASYTNLITRKDAKIDWTKPAQQIEHMVKAFYPEPGAWSMFDGKILKIIKARAVSEAKIELPGKLYRTSDQLMVKCGTGSLLLLEIQPEGKKPMAGKDFANGIRNLSEKLLI